MTWTKLPGEFYDDDRMLTVSRTARLLHVEALCWSNRQGADGRIPAGRLARITDDPDPAAAVDELVREGIWAELEPDVWLIVDHLEDQPTAADVARAQAKNRERQRRLRQHRQGDHELCHPRYCNSRRTLSVSNAVTDGGSNETRAEPSRAVKAKARQVEPRACSTCAGTGNVNSADTRDGLPLVCCPDCRGSKFRVAS